MSLNFKIIYGILTGAWGGLLAWAILDLTLQLEMADPYLDAIANGLVVGVGIGILVGGFTGLIEGNLYRAGRGVVFGLLTGLLGGIIGLAAGEWLFQALGRQEVGRLLGWGMFGLGIGLGEGLLQRSGRRLLHGSLGGLLGGLFGGGAFIFVREFLDKPMVGRAWGFAILGACIGLFIALVPTLLKRAWLKVVSSGRDEGKEYIVEKSVTTLGSANSCDLPLANAPALLPVHAEIQQRNKGFVLYARGSLTVNSQQANQQNLHDGDRIALGRVRLLFRTRKQSD